MRIDEEDAVIGMQTASQGECLLTASEKGYGKRTYIHEFRSQFRGGKGILCYKIMEKTGFWMGSRWELYFGPTRIKILT